MLHALTRRALLTATAAGLLTLAGSYGPALAKTPKDVLVVADKIDDLISLDPAEMFEFSAYDYAQNVYDRLITFDPKNFGPLKPGVAESWSLADDGVTYTFKIRKGLKFHSGNPLTAHDVVYSLRRAVKLKKTPSFILTQFGFTPENVDEKIKALDDYTVQIVTNKPYAPSFVYNCLTAPIAGIVDSKLLKEHEKDGDFGNGWLKTHSAGSGAYKLRVWKPNEIYVLDRAGDYWRGKVAMKAVFVRHIEESSSQRLLLEKGDVDVARKLTPDDIAAVMKNPDLKVENDLKGRIMYFALNQKHPILSKPKVREAFRYLADYEGMTKSFLRGQYVVHQAFLPLTYLGELKEKPYKLDIEKARALLKEAGHGDGFSVKIYVRNAQDRLEIAQSLQNTFAKVGIKAELVVGTGKQILTEYRARKHEIYLGAWGPDYPDPHTNADSFAHNPDNRDEAKLTGKLAWRNSWFNPEVNKMTEAAVLEKDTAKRAEMYRELQRKVQREGPYVIMFQQIIQSAMRKNVNGFITGGAISQVHYWTVTKD